jgi:hypothetical protein
MSIEDLSSHWKDRAEFAEAKLATLQEVVRKHLGDWSDDPKWLDAHLRGNKEIIAACEQNLPGKLAKAKAQGHEEALASLNADLSWCLPGQTNSIDFKKLQQIVLNQ